jgi:hypothetical protein
MELAEVPTDGDTIGAPAAGQCAIVIKRKGYYNEQ